MNLNDLHDLAVRCVPFLSTLSSHPPEQRPLLTRLIEQTAVGVISGAASVMIMLAIHGERIDTLRRDVAEIRMLIEKIRSDLYAPRR